ncbi:MAG: energy transducer TonB [Myxococcota bacterium]
MLVALWAHAFADPVSLPDYTVNPDSLAPQLHSDTTLGNRLDLELSPPADFTLERADSGPVTMLLATVDSPPRPLTSTPTATARTCTLQLAVDPRGHPGRPQILRCDRGLTRRAKRAARRLRFTPAIYGGRPVAVADFVVQVAVIP